MLDRSEQEPNISIRRFGEIFRAFLRLGLTSFGGPTAHIGYFSEQLVKRRGWIDGAGYIDLMTLCQFLPGPTSSQIGFSLGVLRGGLLGGLAAWLGFTMPSAIFLVACAYGAADFKGPMADAVLHGLKLVAVAVVAAAVLDMARGIFVDRVRVIIAVIAKAILVLLGSSLGPIAAIGFGLLAGMRFCQASGFTAAGALHFPVSRRQGITALSLFVLLFIVPPVFKDVQGIALFQAFFHAGAMVFGGGHVVLPMLQTEVVAPGWIGTDAFLTGYGLTQAVPGPLFTFAAYLGTVMTPPPNGVLGAAIALVAVFLPGLLLVYGLLPFWDSLRTRPEMQAAMRGAVAATIAILATAFYNPVFVTGVKNWVDFALAVGGFLLLVAAKMPSWIVVAAMVASSLLVYLATTLIG